MNTCGVGRVLQAGAGHALVEIQREEACQHCSTADLCHALGSRGTLRIDADNPIDAREGQLVEVAPVRSVGLQAALFVYLLPTLMFLVAVVLSIELWHLPVWASALAGLGALGLAWGIARAFDRRVRRRPEFRLRIIRVLGGPDRDSGGGPAAQGDRP